MLFANLTSTRIDLSGDPKVTLHQGYEKKDGLPEEGQPGAFADLEALVDFVATASDSDFAARIATTIDVDSYVAWWLLATFALADDTAYALKIRIGQNSTVDQDQAIAELAESTASEVAQVLGSTFLLYRRHPDEPKIKLP